MIMRIESVEIKNFRQYRDVTFDFSKKGKHDVHIILGSNGIGKTNLLNAISWCLYEKEPHLGNEAIARKRINAAEVEQAIQENRNKCKTQVTVKLMVEDESKCIIFERGQEFKINNTGDPENIFEFMSDLNVTVMSPEGSNILDDEEIENIKKQYIPEDISEYFFFDGEQLDKYFISNQGEKIRDAIYNISQVNLLHSMQERLQHVINEFRNDAAKKNVGVNELNQKVKDAEAKKEELKNRIAECNQQIAKAEGEIITCNEFLAGKDGVPEKEKEYQKLSILIENKEVELKTHSDEFKQFLREYKVLFALYPKLKYTLDLVNSKEEQGQLPPNIDKQFLEKMLKYHKCYICGRDLSDDEEKEVKSLLDQLNLSTSVSHLLVKIKSPLEDTIAKCKKYPEERERLITREAQLKKEKTQLIDRFDKLDSFLKNYQDKDKIREMHEKRSKYDEQKKKNEKDKARFDLQFEAAEKECQKLSDDLAKAIAKQEELKILKKQIGFAEESKKIVCDIETEMMHEVRDKMTKETMDIFDQLDWKQETFSHIELDDSYVLELYDKYGYPMVGACSAAERALLALSFTLALQKVSGYDSMLFIDTPVGRVDLENRANFATVLSQIAENKQVIMTFTPSEYSQEIRDILEPCRSTFKELKTVDESETFIR